MRSTRLAKSSGRRSIPRRLYRALTSNLPSAMRSVKTGKPLSIEQSRKMPHKEQYIDFSMAKVKKPYMKASLAEIISEIKQTSPRAKITLLPQPKVLSWFQDIRVSNISAGQALELQGTLGAHGLTPKDATNILNVMAAVASVEPAVGMIRAIR